MRNYNNYTVWKLSHELTQFIYNKIVPVFPQSEIYNLTGQIKRAAYSVPLNIVEGSGINSEKDFVFEMQQPQHIFLEILCST